MAKRTKYESRNRAGYEQDSVSRRDRANAEWKSAKPAGPVRQWTPEEVAEWNRLVKSVTVRGPARKR